ncbi:Slp family lipoprotein [Sulfurivermis fontis]|uniref:Slp family lipoprotein n=1 Tax=Sulfurivermis fontis TaxID=1972068 RepID=UPI000FD7189F|nr:Slp family lipoprotein [Sulfurivermis fontis]
MLRPFLIAAVLLGLTACAGGPRYDTRAATTDLTAAQVSAAPGTHLGTQVIWGGVIVATRNLTDYTEIEVLAYPLDRNQRPDTGSGEQGRFLARYSGYLESVDYAPGRRLTARGRVEQTVAGKVGDAPYTFPLLQAADIYLWPRDGSAPSGPQFQFGIGVIFSR